MENDASEDIPDMEDNTMKRNNVVKENNSIAGDEVNDVSIHYWNYFIDL